MRKHLSPLIAAVCAASLLYIYYRVMGGLCPMRTVLGIPCPGCGMTRAVCAVLAGDVSSAFSHHPLWPALLPLGIVFLRMLFPRAARSIFAKLRISWAAYLRVEGVVCVILLAAFIAVWVIRLF